MNTSDPKWWSGDRYFFTPLVVGGSVAVAGLKNSIPLGVVTFVLCSALREIAYHLLVRRRRDMQPPNQRL
jgi:hypothetical protein